MSEAEAVIESIVALTTAFARARLAGDEAEHMKPRRKAVLDYIDSHLQRAARDEIADAANLSRAWLYRLLAAEGGIPAILLNRRLDEALRPMFADNNEDGKTIRLQAARPSWPSLARQFFGCAVRSRSSADPRRGIVQGTRAASYAHYRSQNEAF